MNSLILPAMGYIVPLRFLLKDGLGIKYEDWYAIERKKPNLILLKNI